MKKTDNELMTVSEWAARHRVLAEPEAAPTEKWPARWSTEEVISMKAAQMGGFGIQHALGRLLDCDLTP